MCAELCSKFTTQVLVLNTRLVQFRMQVVLPLALLQFVNAVRRQCKSQRKADNGCCKHGAPNTSGRDNQWSRSSRSVICGIIPSSCLTGVWHSQKFHLVHFVWMQRTFNRSTFTMYFFFESNVVLCQHFGIPEAGANSNNAVPWMDFYAYYFGPW